MRAKGLTNVDKQLTYKLLSPLLKPTAGLSSSFIILMAKGNKQNIDANK